MMGNHKGEIISTHAPRTGSDRWAARVGLFQQISTHAPRTGSDMKQEPDFNIDIPISTHAPRTGSDDMRSYAYAVGKEFQPTLPARGATSSACARTRRHTDFNPRSPHGERRAETVYACFRGQFQPTLPARGATLTRRLSTTTSRFQPTLPARGATRATQRVCGSSLAISTHAPRTGSDT